MIKRLRHPTMKQVHAADQLFPVFNFQGILRQGLEPRTEDQGPSNVQRTKNLTDQAGMPRHMI